MIVTLTIRRARHAAERFPGDLTDAQSTTLTLSGTPAEVQAAIDELFSADRATGLREELGLSATSASGFSGPQ